MIHQQQGRVRLQPQTQTQTRMQTQRVGAPLSLSPLPVSPADHPAAATSSASLPLWDHLPLLSPSPFDAESTDADGTSPLVVTDDATMLIHFAAGDWTPEVTPPPSPPRWSLEEHTRVWRCESHERG